MLLHLQLNKLQYFLFWSEEHTSELRHGYISYAVFCLKKKKIPQVKENEQKENPYRKKQTHYTQEESQMVSSADRKNMQKVEMPSAR